GGEVIFGRAFHASFTGAKYEFREEGQVKVNCDEPVSVDELQVRYAHALRCLMTFACDRAQTIDKFSVWKSGATDQEILVVGELIQPEKEDAKDVSWHEMLFTFDMVTFPDFVQRWFHFIEVYKDACDVYFGLLYGPPSYLDMKFENLVNAVLLY